MTSIKYVTDTRTANVQTKSKSISFWKSFSKVGRSTIRWSKIISFRCLLHYTLWIFVVQIHALSIQIEIFNFVISLHIDNLYNSFVCIFSFKKLKRIENRTLAN